MARLKIRFLLAAALVFSSGGLFLATAAPAAGAAAAPAAAGGTICIAHHELRQGHRVRAGGTGHDKPELDPVSSLPGSARDLTWTAVLPRDRRVPVARPGWEARPRGYLGQVGVMRCQRPGGGDGPCGGISWCWTWICSP